MFIYQKLIVIVIIFTLSLLIYSTPANASTVIFADNFDDNNISDWQVVRNQQSRNTNLPCFNNGQPSTWYGLNGKINMYIVNSPSCITEIIPNNLDLSTILNYTYEFDMTLVDTIYADRNTVFIWKDANNWYDIKLYGTSIIVQKVVNGQVKYLQNSTGGYGFSPNSTYKFKILLEDNIIKVFINNELLLSINDTAPYIDGYKTIGLQASVGAVNSSKVQFDNIIVTSLDDGQTTLPIEQLKQTDPHWADIEYDSANAWSPALSKIKDWGCALTSAVMIMRFHGITIMPDGSTLDPASLNNWLKNQTDGYAHGGLINWFAVTRLTKLISAVHNTPKLEYNRFNGTTHDKAISEITANKPVMLEIPGHFIVGKGIENNDIIINDPYYSHSSLSQHNKPLLSTRTFHPSQTDLSGFYISTSANAHIGLMRDLAPVSDVTESTEFVSEPGGNTSSPIAHVLEYSKPTAGNYTVDIQTNHPFEQYSLHLHVYNKDGSVSSKVKEMISGYDSEDSFTFMYDGTGFVQIEQSSSFSDIKNTIEPLFSTHDIKKKYITFVLIKYLDLAQQSTTPQQIRWTSYIAEVIVKHTVLFSDTGIGYLLQELEIIRDSLTAD